ncbi:MAG TPA: hypothetical protein VN922_05650, partial [Bacteroidia bacterium]|nr:hypothetical protein [Bacteroidia bacterium]
KEKFIVEEENNLLRPYKWVGINKNKELAILSIIDGTDSVKALKKKARDFSDPYQIARLGITLLLMGKLEIRKSNFVSTRLARAILNYYHIDDPTLTITDAFKKSHWQDSKDYAKYYLNLKKAF